MTPLQDKIAALPPIKFVCGRDWYSGPNNYCVGVYWRRNLDAQDEGEIAYLRHFLVRLKFRLWIENA